ncbi:ATPase RavA [Thalassoglobus neptunius]|uniref:ATPase RavA n=1 Tax=Thalassoglobus neptunius TaxID=1938619 RepID=A0A5C5X6J9_9PLAN|nr:MoxR family ATPase [Thalassoglobus neptunius]TWT57765.1 ATPase RavA [Thalassoglobus neptunius]
MPSEQPDSATLDSLILLRKSMSELREELRQVVVGQSEVIDQILLSILCGGHSLLVGVPGLAKTLVVKALAETLGLTFNRVQFTPDLMPADITGTEVLQEDKKTGHREFRFIEGPIFAQVVLADEINRTPPKTQAALLEAMQERQVTAGGHKHILPSPFFVLATQNPIEQEGTYPLPEAQLDRFMMEIRVDYPSENEELEIVRQQSRRKSVQLKQVLSTESLLKFAETVDAMPIADHDVRYAIALVRASRPSNAEAVSATKNYIQWGAGPRGSECLVSAAKGHAAIHGQNFASYENIQAVFEPVMRHRIVLSYNAEADGVSIDDVLAQLLEQVPPPTQGPVQKVFQKFLTKAEH